MRPQHDHEFDARSKPLQEHMLWIKVSWVAEKIGFIALAAFILYALLGGFSQGWLSDSIIKSPQGTLEVVTDKYLRTSSESPLIIHYRPNEQGETAITLQGNFIDEYDISDILPPNALIESEPGKWVITFHPPKNQTRATVKLMLKPRDFGRYNVAISIDNQQEIKLQQIVFP